jgi:hypothetical protein
MLSMMHYGLRGGEAGSSVVVSTGYFRSTLLSLVLIETKLCKNKK